MASPTTATGVIQFSQRLCCGLFAPALMAFALATPASAAGTYSWTGGGGNTSWSTTGNWASGAAPVAASNTINFAGSAGTSNTNDISSLSLSRLNFLNSASAFTLSGSSITLSSGTISNASSNLQTINLGITLDGSNTISLAGAGRPLTIGGLIAGSGSLTKSGVSLLTLSGSNNTYTGLTTVSAGTLAYGASDAIGSGGVTVAGGTIAMGNYSDTVGAVTVGAGASAGVITGGNGTLTASSYTLVTGSVSASLAGSGTVSKASNTLMTLTGSNSFTGDLAISAGTLNIQNSFALGSTSGSTSIAANAVLQLENNITLAGETIQFATSGTNGSIRNISGTNTISGSVAMTAATGRINSDAGLLQINGANPLSSSTNATLSVGGAGDTLISSVLALGSGGLTKDGAGTLTLSGSNTYTGQTTVSEGKLVYGTNNALATGAVVIGSATTSGVFNLGTYADSVGRLTLTSGTLAMAANSPSQAQLVSTGTILLGTTNTLDLAGTAWNSGYYKLLAGTAITGTFGTVNNLQNGYSLVYGGTSMLDLQQQAVLGTVTVIPASGSIITGGSLAIGYTVANAAQSGGADLAFTGTAGSNLSGSSTSGTAAAGSTSGTISGMTFTGATTGSNQAGVFTISAPGAYGTTSTTSSISVNVFDHAAPAAASLAGGTLALGGVHAGYASAVSTNSLSGSNEAGYRVNMSGSAAAANGISLTTLSGVAAGSSSAITATLAGGASLGAISQNFTYTFADDSNLSGASSNTGTAAITVTGSVYTGQSTWATNGSGSWGTLNNLFGTNWGVNEGSPGLDAGFTNTDTATFGSALTSGTAVVSLNGASPSLRSITFNNSGATYNIAQGSGGTLTLSGSGGAATVDVIAGSHTISSQLILASSANINVASIGALTLEGGVSGSGALEKQGAGVLTLAGVNTYSGATDVFAGELKANGTTAVASAVTIASAATLSGTGTIGGNTTISGTHRPGDALGVQTFTNNLTYSGTSGPSVYWQLTGNTTSNSPLAYNQMAVGGTLDFATSTSLNLAFGSANSTVDWSNSFWSGWQYWTLYNVSGTTANSANLLLAGNDWVDASGDLLSSVRSGYTFQVSQMGNNIVISYVPEPSTYAMAFVALGMGGWRAWRRRKAAAAGRIA